MIRALACCHLKLIMSLSEAVHTANIADNVKTKENFKTVTPKSGSGSAQEADVFGEVPK